jgi:hypothetical protein
MSDRGHVDLDADRETLRCREAAAKAKLRAAARSLGDSIASGVRREQRLHPWVLPIAGFCTGFLIPFLLPDRASRARAARAARPPAPSKLRDAWADARCAAAETLTQAVGAAIRRLLDPPPRSPTGDSNGCSR